MASNRKKLLYLSLFITAFCCSCSQSPFGEDITETSSRELFGKVVLQNSEDPEGVYIWMEGTSFNAHTDHKGDFQIELPKSIGNNAKFEDGIFSLHFYVANFALASSTVLVKNGEFVRSRGDINDEGELIGFKRMLKILKISTEVDPARVNPDYQGVIHVSVSLLALGDSVTVALPKSIEVQLGAVVFRNAVTGVAVSHLASADAQRFSYEKIGPEERVLQYDFMFSPGMLQEGEYEIVPFLLIEQENMPDGLLESLGANVDQIGPNFLKIPYKREGGSFVVFEI